MAKRIKTNPKKDQYYAAKYKGSNGDLIIGKVKSVRRDGDVILTNLLTGNKSTKSIKILAARNHQVTKSEADKIVGRASKAAARTLAVRYWKRKNTAKQHPAIKAKRAEMAKEAKIAKQQRAVDKAKLIRKIHELGMQIESLGKQLEENTRWLAQLELP